jgi:hypothetical protein
MKVKYIRTKNNGFILFSLLVNHSDMARIVHDEVISAGFVAFGKDECGNTQFECYGKSVSLDIGSKDDDTKAINRNMEITQY